MRRFQLFEFGDQPWLKGWARECYLDCLNFGLRTAGQFRGILEPLLQWVGPPPHPDILDLGSGGGGPIETLLMEGAKRGVVLPRFILSDLYPSAEHYKSLVARYGEARLGFLAQPVSADRVPQGSPPLRIICSAFHHFRPELARTVVEDAVRSSDGLFIVEPLQRDWRHLLMVLLSGPLPYMGAPFVASRKSFMKFLFCLLIPVFPLMVMFDGCVSVLRTYQPDEMLDMIPRDDRKRFTAEWGVSPYFRIFGAPYFFVRRRQTPAR
jgi:hypothetical protein